MNATRTSVLPLGLAVLTLASGLWALHLHASAWRLGQGSPVLAYDAAQYAVAARELADHGRLATPFALPIELSRHAEPPWPLALVQPGLVAVEAGLFKVLGARPGSEWLVLVLPAACFLLIALILTVGTHSLLGRHGDQVSRPERALGALVIGLAFLLDPEAQHFGVGGFTELPFTLGLVAALVTLASGAAQRHPLRFGLLLGAAGLFRGNMLWLAPILAGGAAAAAERRRLSVFGLAMLGYALPLAPWWIYKWRAFGTPAWDLAWVSIWDGVGGRTWFSLNHLPDLPEVPRGLAAAAAIATKVARNLPALVLDLARGPRALWIGALLIWTFALRPPRTLVVAGLVALAVLLASLVAGAASVPIPRYLFPARVAIEVAGLLALWALVGRAPPAILGPAGQRAVRVAFAALALVWGGWETARGLTEARAASESRGVPSTQAMLELADRLDRELALGEPVMSNLGPVLAWYTRRPVVHLALSPADVDACRRRLDVRHVLLVFREPARAWSDWSLVLERPVEATQNHDWNITRVVPFQTRDGFMAAWLELGPLEPRMAVGR